jgi:hypothetical protein
MKIFLTEFTGSVDEQIYSGPSICAPDFDSAQEMAETMGLTVVGELTNLMLAQMQVESETIH